MNRREELGGRIKGARKLRGLNQRQLAKAVGVSAMGISKYERGLVTPGSKILIKISKATKKPLAYFLRASGVEVHGLSFRAKRHRMPAKTIHKAEAFAKDWLERFLELETISEVGADSPGIQLGEDFCFGYSASAENAANQVREKWGIGGDAISSLTGLLEDQQIYVGSFDGLAKVDALSFKTDKGLSAILVRNDLPGDRQRFSLAHELAHLLFDKGGSKEDERWASSFAACFLVPRTKVLQELGKKRTELHDLELHLLKHKYGLSMQAWVKRAFHAGVISSASCRKKLKHFRKEGWLEKEPWDQLKPETPQRMTRLILRSLNEELISKRRAEDLLGMKWCEFQKSMASFHDGPPVETHS